MKYNVRYADTEKVMHVDILEKFEPEDVEKLIEELKTDYTEDQRDYMLLKMHESAQAMPSKETRKAMREKASGFTWQRSAVVGAKSVTRMIAKVVMAAIGKANEIQFFKEDSEAVDWLKKEREKATTSGK